MAVIAGLRAVMHQSLECSLRHGPFPFSLTDLRKSNIFVDEQSINKSLDSMDWASSIPVEMQQLPYLLIRCDTDEMKGELNFQPVRQGKRGLHESF